MPQPEPVDLHKYLRELFKSHEVPFHVENEWVVPFGTLPAIRGTWYQNEHSGVFEVEVLLEDKRILNECFSGFGIGEQGILNGLENFCINSFHVLLAAFWSKAVPAQVDIEKWTINGSLYDVYIGNFGTRATEGVEPHIPNNFFESIENTIKNEKINHDLSWFRLFFGSVSGNFTIEALKDNEYWGSGESLLKSQEWQTPLGFYSVRNFIILRKI